MSEHTPTPWEVKRHDLAAGQIMYEIIHPSTGTRIASSDDMLNAHAREHAAFLVRAANSHEGLVEQCEYLITVAAAMAHKEPRDVFDWKLVCDRARAALAKARKTDE